MSLISHSAHRCLSTHQYAVNTVLIVDESFVLLKRECGSIETIFSEGKEVRLRAYLFCSVYLKLVLILA